MNRPASTFVFAALALSRAIPHLMGLDHARLTFRHTGLTQVAGKVVSGILS